MRIRSSFATAVAAAVSAVVFSAAFQPVQAALVTIDDFTQATGTNSVSGTSGFIVSTGIDGTISGTYNTRNRLSSVAQANPRQGRTASTSVGSGVGTLGFTTTGTTSPNIDVGSSFNYLNSPGADRNLIAATAGDFAGFVIKTGSIATLPAGFLSYVSVGTNNDVNFGRFNIVPGWAANQTYYIPFSSFDSTGSPLPADFASVSSVQVGFDTPVGGVIGSTPYTGTVQFTLVAVPEPTQMVFVAGVAATLGAWRMRKLRRSRGESEAAAV